MAFAAFIFSLIVALSSSGRFSKVPSAVWSLSSKSATSLINPLLELPIAVSVLVTRSANFCNSEELAFLATSWFVRAKSFELAFLSISSLLA
jgi:hypothetical protein